MARTALGTADFAGRPELLPVTPPGRPWLDGFGDARESAAASGRDGLSFGDITERVQKALTELEHDDGSRTVQLAQNGDAHAQQQLVQRIREVLRQQRLLTAGLDEDTLAREVFDHLYGFRELAPFFHDPEVEEIQVNRPDSVFVVRSGRLERAGVRLRDEWTLEHFLLPRLFGASGQAISREHPAIEHVRADGTRLTATIPPRSPHATLTVRKHSRLLLDRELWVRYGSAPPRLLRSLGALVRWRTSVLISGPTNSGKTTLLRLLVGYTDEHMRWVTLATDRELHLTEAYPERNILEMEVGGRGEIDDLFRTVLRETPTAVVMEEIRNGPEAEAMLMTVQRGHDGSFSTVHVTRADQIAFQVAKMSLEGKPLDPTTVVLRWREVAECFPVVVQMASDPLDSGRRLIEEVGQYVLRGVDEPPAYEPVCTWRQSGARPYGEGAWHWVGEFGEDVLRQVERHGGRRDDVAVPRGTVEGWSPR